MTTFSVWVVGYNVKAFMIAYAPYIKRWHEAWFNERVFDMEAPKEVRDEIADLKEEFIEIMED